MQIEMILRCACVVTFPLAFYAVTSYSCKLNTLVFVIWLHVHNVNFLNRQHILMLLLEIFNCVITSLATEDR